jgi:hypothetical protein
MGNRRVVSGLLGAVCVVALAGCGSKAKSASLPTVTTKAGAAGSSSVVTTKPAKAVAKDCGAFTTAMQREVINWQLVTSLPKEANVSKWPDRVKILGTLDQFGAQLDTLKSVVGDDAEAAKSIEFMRGANDIAQRGLGGDKAAPKALGDYLGTDLGALLKKHGPIADAAKSHGCI